MKLVTRRTNPIETRENKTFVPRGNNIGQLFVKLPINLWSWLPLSNLKGNTKEKISSEKRTIVEFYKPAQDRRGTVHREGQRTSRTIIALAIVRRGIRSWSLSREAASVRVRARPKCTDRAFIRQLANLLADASSVKTESGGAGEK